MALSDDVRIGKRGEMTLPMTIRKAFARTYGSELTEATATLRDDGVIEFRPHMRVDPTQAFFWTPEWQRAEAAAQADIDAGRVTQHDSGDDFLGSLDQA